MWAKKDGVWCGARKRKIPVGGPTETRAIRVYTNAWVPGAAVGVSHIAGTMSEEEMESTEERTREQLFPLNSLCLTASILGRIATDLGVPGGGSLADTRQMVEGALDERGRLPQNVLVNL